MYYFTKIIHYKRLKHIKTNIKTLLFMNATKTVKKNDLKHDLSVFPNFHKTGSITGMKKKYYGMDCLLIRSGSYIYKVTEEIYNAY